MNWSLDFNRTKWGRDEALVFLFFSDWREISAEPADFNRAKIRVRDLMIGAIFDIALPEIERDELVISTIEKLKNLSPALCTTEHASPLLWVRFAFTALRNSISPAGFFLDQYAKWRFIRSLEYPGETIIRVAKASNGLMKPESFKICGQTFEGYSLDSYFLSTTLQANIDSKSQWALSTTLTSRKIKTKNSKIEEDVGKGALKYIHECILDAVKSSKIDGLQNRKTQGRFISTVSRTVLAEALLMKYGRQMPYGKWTVIKALTKYVACPNYRRKRE